MNSSEDEDEFVGFCSDLEEATAPKPVAETSKTALEASKTAAAEPASEKLGEHLKTNVEWASLGLSKPILKTLREIGFKAPTPIQRDAIPQAIEGKDVLGMAETGSGKTLAFLLPAIERLLHSPLVQRRRLNPVTGEIKGSSATATKVLILLPTRELAEQCFKTCQQLCKYLPITQCLLKGSTSLKESEAEMRKQPDIVIATPGRCLDLLLNSSNVHMDLLDIIVFDEADRLLDLGFKAECLAVLENCSPSKQTLLFSATLTSQAEELAALALKRPVKIGTVERDNKTARHIQQTFVQVQDEEERLAALMRVLELETQEDYDRRLVVFFNTKRACHMATLLVQYMDIRLPPVTEVHGNLTASDRAENMRKFEAQEVNILFATDVAARGLDLEDVSLVINATPPNEATKYVHRVGRTGRKGQSGEAVTIFVNSKERALVKEIFKKTSATKKQEFRPIQLDDKCRADMVRRVADAWPRVKDMMKLEDAEKSVDKMVQTTLALENRIKHQDEIQARGKRIFLDRKKPARAKMAKCV